MGSCSGPAAHVSSGGNASVLETPGSRQPVVCHLFRAKKADVLSRAILYTYIKRTNDSEVVGVDGRADGRSDLPCKIQMLKAEPVIDARNAARQP
jgi:hypothetical protein